MGAERYALVQRILHWLIAVAIVGLFAVGSFMSDIGFSSDVSPEMAALRDQLYAAHKATGVLILALVALRLLLRLAIGAPPPADLPRLQALAAGAAHVALYVLMIATPMLGWLAVSAGGFQTLSPLADAQLPALLAKDPKLATQLFEFHEIAATALVAIAAIHAAGGLYHAFRGDGVFKRMWFGGEAA